MAEGHICRRCGACCRNVSASFWVFAEHELIQRLQELLKAHLYVGKRDTGPCDMLIFEPSGRAVCLVEKYLGHSAKPDACRDYPFDEGDCPGQERAAKLEAKRAMVAGGKERRGR